jgi:hypothetical protein
LGEHWAKIGALEHASIASFARFSLQLLSLGAPPDLLMASHQAATDEVRHAQLAFGVAQVLLDRPVGPGPLSLDGVGLRDDRFEAIWDLIVEGCVGETAGAAEARAAAAACTDPVLAAIFAQIAEDEEAHAALAWRTLRWMLEAASPELQARAVAALETGLAELLRPGHSQHGSELAGFGRLASADLLALRERVALRVIRPCFAALLPVTRADELA